MVDEAPERRLRLGVVFAGDPDARGAWSGGPAGIADALRELGCAVEPVNAGPAPALEWLAAHVLALRRLHKAQVPGLRDRARVSRTIARHTGPQLTRMRTRAVRQRLRRTQPLDAAVQLGTEYVLPGELDVVTYEDMTVAQALALPYPEWRGLSVSERSARLATQARVYAQATACCFATRWAADSAIGDYGVDPAKVHVVGIGRNHSPRLADRDWRTPRFLLVASDWERKNGEAVVRAFARVRDASPEARLDIVGRHPRVELDGVTGHGRMSLDDDAERRRLSELFEAATCFVMPSRYEPAGIAYLDAGAAGVPSIGTTVGGSAELIGDGGCVVDPDDEEALVDAMLRLADPDEARAAGARALARADRFAWTAVAGRILAALDDRA